jgi:hypothetical protein
MASSSPNIAAIAATITHVVFILVSLVFLVAISKDWVFITSSLRYFLPASVISYSFSRSLLRFVTIKYLLDRFSTMKYSFIAIEGLRSCTTASSLVWVILCSPKSSRKRSRMKISFEEVWLSISNSLIVNKNLNRTLCHKYNHLV